MFFGSILCASGSFSQEKPGEYPKREVDRPLLLLPDMYEVTFGVSHQDADDIFNRDGDLESFGDTYRVTTLMFDIDYGINPRWQIGVSVPYFDGEIGEAEGAGIGDISANITYGLMPNPVSFFAAVFAGMTYPSGAHDRDYTMNDEGDQVLRSFVTGDPTVNVFAGLEMKWHLRSFAIEGRAEYINTFEGNADVDYGDLFKEERNVDPGESIIAGMTGIYQIWDRLALLIDLGYFSRTETEIDGDGIDDETMSLTAGPRVLFQTSEELDISVGAHYVIDGVNTAAGVPIIVQVKTRF